MTLLAAERISKRFKDQVIVEDLSFTIQEGERIALVGKNGIGKTTLLEILADKQRPDSGAITRSRACLVDYVEQEKTDYLEMSLFDFVADSRADLLEMHRRIQELEHHLEEQPGDEDSLRRLGELQQAFEQQDGFNFDNEITLILAGLGFERDRFDDRLANFSGGEKNRAGLARLLAGRGNLLLLDEPTNHLDIESTAWLEDYLNKLDKACLIVSHDRAFLNSTSDKIWEMAYGKIEVYTGGINRYLADRTHRRERHELRYRHQQEEIKRIEDFIQRNMAGQKTKQAQSRLKYLARIKRLEAPRNDPKGPAIKLESSGRSWAHVLSLEDVTLGYGQIPVVEGVKFDIYRGDKVGLIGRNGSGKSTLLRALIGELEPTDGSIKLGNNVEVAYFDQELSDLNESVSVLDNIWEVDPSAEAGTMRGFLGRFGFTGEDVFKAVAALSGGEKTKLCLAKLLYHPANLVILDEPTNHLDIYAREALEAALQEFDGSCLVVSHDRYFLDEVVDKIVYINEGAAEVYPGNYSYFHEKTVERQPAAVKLQKDKTDFLEFKEASKRRSRLKKQIEFTREKVAEMEIELTELVEKLNNGVPADDWEQLQALTKRKQELENEIIELYETLEELENTPRD